MPRVGDLFIEIVNSEKFSAALQEFDEAMRKIDKSLTRLKPDRRKGESLVDWGNRLDRAGIFDNPEIRWEYQKETWRTMFRIIMKPIDWIVKKLASAMENSF